MIAILFIGSPAAPAQSGEGQESLYDRLGGLAPISVVVSDFIDALVPDAVLNENPAIDAARVRVPAPYLKYHVTAMVCQVSGGPCRYHGRGMKEAHAHLSITEEEWDRMVTIFKEVLAKHQVPSKGDPGTPGNPRFDESRHRCSTAEMICPSLPRASRREGGHEG